MSETFNRAASSFAQSTDRQIGRGAYQRGRAFTNAVSDFLPKHSHVLDYGCGPGRLAMMLAESGYRIRGVDTSPSMIELALAQKAYPGDVTFEVRSLSDILTEGVAYDAIICSSVIEYVADPAEFLRHLRDLLRPGGYLFITFANRKSLWRYLARQLRRSNMLREQRTTWHDAACDALLRGSGFGLERPLGHLESPLDRIPVISRLSNSSYVGTLTFAVARKV